MSIQSCADFCRVVVGNPEVGVDQLKQLASDGFACDKVYPGSIHRLGAGIVFIAKIEDQKKLVLVNQDPRGEFRFVADGEIAVPGGRVQTAPLTGANAAMLRQAFPFTAPVAFGRTGLSIGLGDRLGLASPGHIRVVRETAARPVLAQQSVREINLTDRTFGDVLDAATWAVFQEGYQDGFGADGDHLKQVAEVTAALASGFSMITLDCSEKIDNTVGGKNAAAVAAAYGSLPASYRERIEAAYLGKSFRMADGTIDFDAAVLQQCALIYGKALAYAGEVYFGLIRNEPRIVDFELSIDETATPTTPEAHYFVAAELSAAGIEVTSLAPRFIGEFQKAIDYIGDLAEFDRQFKAHAAIADAFGYRLSIHSGSDKFGVYPSIARYTKGRVHVKTAGTNWLEALKVIARKDPALLRRIYAHALAHFSEATRYYHVTTNLGNVPDLATITDSELAGLLEQNDVRQVLHITYGVILTAAGPDGTLLFKGAIYELLNAQEEAYARQLEQHIGKHLRLLGQ